MEDISYIKPSLLNKKTIIELIHQKQKNNKNLKNINENNIINKKNIYFNILIILFFVIGILFLFYRYIEKKKNLHKNNKDNINNI
jgi:ascorbate-specific PTS system EIIC-type component UlaA